VLATVLAAVLKEEASAGRFMPRVFNASAKTSMPQGQSCQGLATAGISRLHAGPVNAGNARPDFNPFDEFLENKESFLYNFFIYIRL
jgi:hypothetical protein